MIISKKLIEELQRRLKIGNRKGVHLNAIPKNSTYKFDLHNLSIIEEDLPNKFIEELLSKNKFKFKVSWKDIEIDLFTLDVKEQKKYLNLGKSFEKILSQVETIKSEKGLETFGFGFPLVARRDVKDQKITVAPLVIWQLELKKSRENDTWEVIKNEDSPIYINEVLINHLRSDSDINIEQIPSEALEDNVLNRDELLDICIKTFLKLNKGSAEKITEGVKNVFTNVVPIGTEAEYNEIAFNDRNSLLKFAGVFSYFEIQKNNIIKEYDELLKLEGEEIEQGEIHGNNFQSLTSISTDPTQQEVLNSIESNRNLVIQGPPGTGKSQTLTAILINALENKKKSIVVCEKNTALEVLAESLEKNGLGQHVTIINDVTTSRYKVVSSVRDKLQNIKLLSENYKHSHLKYNSKISLLKETIDKINSKHKILDQKLLNEYNWTDVVGLYLSSLRKINEEINQIEPNIDLQFTYEEFENLLNIIKEGEILNNELLIFDLESFIEPESYNANSIYDLEDRISESFKYYENGILDIKLLSKKTKDDYASLRIQNFNKQTSEINELVQKLNEVKIDLKEETDRALKAFEDLENYELNNEFESTLLIIERLNFLLDKNIKDLRFKDESISYSPFFKIQSIFSNKKKELVADQKEFIDSYEELKEITSNFKHLPNLKSRIDLTSRINEFILFQANVKDLKDSFKSLLDKDFNDLDLGHLKSLKTYDDLISHVELLQRRPSLKKTLNNVLGDVLTNFEEKLQEQKNIYKEINYFFYNDTDFKYTFNFQNNYIDNSHQITAIEGRIKNVNSTVNDIIQFEILNIDLLEKFELFTDLKSFLDLNLALQKLYSKINSDGFIKISEFPKNLNSFTIILDNKIEIYENLFLNNKDSFEANYNWYKYFNRLSENEKILINSLRKSKNWEESFSVYYFNKILRESATDNHPNSDILIHKYFKDKSEIGKNQIDYIHNYWYNNQLNAIEKYDRHNIGLKVKNLYNLKKSVGHKRYSLRNIVNTDIDLFTTFFPIILTTPDVASNLFKNQNKYFDLVLFDEASQLRLEDTLPAMLKAKQIIISGDEHQMPPSNYFAKIYEGEVDNEEDIELDEATNVIDRSSVDALAISCVSLLEFGTEMDFKTKYLDFHYRSKHPYLIEFSNYAFYKQRLKPLPNVYEYNPIKYINVDGVFDGGENYVEAEMVLSILENNIHKKENGEYPSVGIATSNLSQRNLIKSKIIERQKLEKYKLFNEKIIELEANGLFVKNLENIQGDERDIMIISTTYGKNSEGKFYERFGPLNFDKGYKLLNVIITRAKYKNYIITSIPEDKILNFKSYLVTQGSNIKKAPIIPYLAYAKAVSENNEQMRKLVLESLEANIVSNLNSDIAPRFESPFEEEVYQRLSETIDKKYLFTQYKVGGFRIDLVVDFKIKGLPKIAIECDGAKYHSSNEAYLYDTHRQIILESQGFKFIRIWGTNWWRKPERELIKLLEFIETIRGSQIDAFSSLVYFEGGFNDEIIDIIPESLENDIQSFEQFENEKEDDIVIVKRSPQIKLGTEVLIKFLNDNSRIRFKIVNKAEKDKFISDEVKPLFIDSPLGKAISNKSIGDIAKIEGLDRSVEILELS